MKYVSKPKVIEAVQWTGRNTREVREFIAEHGAPLGHATFVPRRGGQMTETLFSNMIKAPAKEVSAALWVEANGDWLGIVNTEWIIVDTLGFYPCKNEVFKVSYGPTEEA